MQAERNYYCCKYKDVRISNFWWSHWKITRVEKTTRRNCRGVLRLGRTCSKIRWERLRTGEQQDRAIVQSLTSTISRKRNLNQLETCQRYAHKLYWNACIWHEFVDLTFSGKWTKLLDQSLNGLRHVTDDKQDWTNLLDQSHADMQPFSFKHKSRVSCPIELRKVRLKKVRQWRKRDQWIWCEGTSWAQRKLLRKIRVLRTARGAQELDQSHVSPSGRKLTRKRNQDPKRILKRGNKMTLNLPAPGNQGGAVNLQAQPTPGNWSEVMTFKSQGEGWNSTICKSPTIDKVESRTVIGTEALQTNVLIGWLFISTIDSRNPRVCSMSRRDWRWTIKLKFWMYHRLIGQLPHGRDLHLRSTKWLRGRKQKCTSTQIPSFAWKNVRAFRSESEMANPVEEFRQSNSYRELLGTDGEPIEFDWNIFQDLLHSRSPKRSEKTWGIKTLSL